MFKDKKNSSKPPRQDWQPHWALKLLYRVWMVVFTVAKVAIAAAATVALIFGICLVVFIGSLSDFLESDVLKDASIDLSDTVKDSNSFVYYYDSNGNVQLQQKIFADVYTSWADYEDIPEDLIHAAIAIEDKRFYEHQGVDWVTTVKACAGMFFGDADAGGSTITQQLVKNHTGDNDVTVQRKLLEIFRANDIEKRYDKEVIMEYYLNEIWFGRKCQGVRTAAAKYFGKELEMLTTAECASLISITNNPSMYDPYGSSVYALSEGGEEMNGYQRNNYRKNLVLNEMLEQGWLTQEEYDIAVAEVIVNKDGIDLEDQFANCKNDECNYRGLVSSYIHKNDSYLCPVCNTDAGISEGASLQVYSYFTDTVIEDVAMALAERDGMTWNNDTKAYYKSYISRAGFHIYSTMDMEVQNQVDKIYTDLSQIPKTRGSSQLQSAIVVIDNESGDIVAICGGVGEKIVHDGLNRAIDSELQSGSSLKPISVYGPAFNIQGYSPATIIKDMPLKYNGSTGWPKNDNRKYNYSLTMHQAIVRSVNAVAANTLDEIGLSYAYDFAKNKFGLSTLTRSYVMPNGTIKTDEDYAPLAAGAQTVGVTVRDMANAFSTFAYNGVRRQARTWLYVYDSNGNLVLENKQISEQILSEKAVNYMNYCLEDAVAGGTGTEARIKNAYVYGKTGTTASDKDRWFCGFTKYYTAAIWCGYDQPEQIFMRGGVNNPSAYLFSKVLTPLHANVKKADTGMVNWKGFTYVQVCLDCGKLATEACEKDVRAGSGFTRVSEKVRVLSADVPKQKCDCHTIVEYCSGGGVATEWCKLFALENQATIEEKALVRISVEKFNEIKKASKTGLVDAYVRDDYIYLVDKKGEDAAFKGFKNNLNKEEDHPYLVCPDHTEKSWNEYQQSKTPVVPGPDDPADPSAPSVTPNPTTPPEPTVPETTTPPETTPNRGELPEVG